MGLTVNLRQANLLKLNFLGMLKYLEMLLNLRVKNIDLNSTTRSTQRSYKEIKEYVLC